MLYCYDLNNGITVINSETLEIYTISYEELFEMSKKREFVSGLYTDYRTENGNPLYVEEYLICYNCSGYVKDTCNHNLGTEYDIKTHTFTRTEGKHVIYKGTKMPIKFKTFACKDFSVTLEDIIIVRIDKYSYEVWHKGKCAKFYTDQIGGVRGICRVPEGFGDIAICWYKGSGVTDVIPLERYMNTDGVDMLRLDFMLKHRLVLI